VHTWQILGTRAPKCVAFHVMVSFPTFSRLVSLIVHSFAQRAEL